MARTLPADQDESSGRWSGGQHERIFNRERVRIFVDDIERARHFYRDVLELDETSATPDWAVFDLDGKNIIVEKVAADDPRA